MEAATSPSAMTEQDLKTGLSRLGEGSRPAPASVRVLGFAVALDELGQVVVARVLQESPAAYSGQVGVGDVVEAVDGRMVTSVQQLAVAADGLEGTLVALELRRKDDSHLESLHLMRQLPHGSSDPGSSDGERAGLGARVVHDVRGMKVCDLYEGSSSYWSTLKIDDIVCAVDGQDIRHGPPSLVLQLTNGAIGTSMCLHVIRREAQDDEISGALSARGLGGRDSVDVNWKDGKQPAVSGNEKLMRVHVVRSRPLADSALSRALAYRARVVELLQARIERALLEGGGVDLDSEDQGDEDTSLNGHKAYAREPGDITKLSDTRSLLSDAQPTSSPGAHGADMHEKSELSLQGGVSIHEGVEPDAKNHDSSPLKTPRTSKLEAQLMSLQDRHENEMRKLQEQIAGLARVIKTGDKMSVGSDEESRAREVEKGLLECVEKMRLQQQEEKKNTITLFQRVCQETMATQERMAGQLYSEIDEVRKQAGENSHVYHRLAEQVEKLNLNNVLLGNIPEHSIVKASHPAEYKAAGRNSVPQLPLSNPKAARVPALPMSTMQSQKAAAKQHSKTADEPVGASPDRFMYCHIERGSVVAKLNILPDSSGTDPRPCMRLAEELAAQVAHPHSPVRKAPVTKPATKVVIHQPIALGGSIQGGAQLERLDEAAVGNFVESPRTFSDRDVDSPGGEQGFHEEWSEAQKQEDLSAMKQRLEEMDAIVSNLAAANPIDPATISGTTERERRPERTSDSYPPPLTMPDDASPPKEQRPISVMDLSLEARSADRGRNDDSKYSLQHRQHMRASTASRENEYRRLPNSSALELESVLSRLEHQSVPTIAQSANRDSSNGALPRLHGLRNGSKAYNPKDSEFLSPHLATRVSEKGTLTPGSETSMNVSRRSPSPAEPKRWRVLPQWSESQAESTVNGKATPRLQLGTPRSHVSTQPSSARGAKEPQTFERSGVRLPDPELSEPAWSVRAGARAVENSASQRHASPNRRRRQYVRSDSSSDEEGAERQRVKPSPSLTSVSSARSGDNKKMGDANEKKLLTNAKSILNDSESDEEIRVRASDLPVRRLANQLKSDQRFHK